MTKQDKTQEAIKIGIKELNLLKSQSVFPHHILKADFQEALQHILQIAERAGDVERILAIINEWDKQCEPHIIIEAKQQLAHSLSNWLKGEEK